MYTDIKKRTGLGGRFCGAQTTSRIILGAYPRLQKSYGFKGIPAKVLTVL